MSSIPIDLPHTLLSKTTSRRREYIRRAAELKKRVGIVDEKGEEENHKKARKKMGVEKQLLRPGTGPKPIPGQNVTVHCTGFGQSFSFSLFLSKP